MFRTQIYIPETIHHEAKTLAHRREETLAKFLRRIIVAGLKAEKKITKPRALDTLARLKIMGGPKDLSRKMDRYLYEK